MRTAVYAGSFDPLTNGHLWMIRRGAEVFDRLVVAVGDNPDKRCMFTRDERLAMLRETTADVPRVEIDSFENRYLVHYAHDIGAGWILRGIRSPGDFGYEHGMRHVNADLQPGIETVFLIPPREIAEVSSSLVKGLVGPAGWEEIVRRYVPAPVFERILARHPSRQ